nr:restriction endonuclease subunit S [uncultured Desulfobacter sp.]
MAGKYQPYPVYMDSGVEWLGEVPVHWDIVQIKHLSSVKRGASPRPIEDEKYFQENGEYAWTRIADVTSSSTYLKTSLQRLSDLGSSLSVKLEPGELFLSIAGTVGKPCITAIKACIHDGFVYFPELKIPPKFLFYVFAGEQAYKGLGKFGTQLNLNTDTVGTIKIGLSDYREQTQIVSFLDHETAKIDTLIAKQEKLIELLQEKRQAVISHAVTKGLDPDVPMKDSGVEWLGEVPVHWDINKIGQLYNESSTKATTLEEQRLPILSVSIHSGISDTELSEDELDRKVARSEDRSLYKVVHKNDIAYNMMRAWQGGFGAPIVNGLISPAYVVCRPKTKIDSKFVELVLRTPNAITELKRYSKGITDFRLRLYWDEFKKSISLAPQSQKSRKS